MMTSQASKSQLIVDVPANIAYLDASAKKFFEHVLNLFAQSNSQHQTIIFNQTEPITPLTKKHLDFLKNDCLFDVLFMSIELFYDALNAIRLSTKQTVYISEFSCYGAAFEFALACSVKIFSSSAHELGFPELEARVAPLFLAEKKFNHWPLPWKSTAVVDPMTAVQLGVIDSCLPEVDFKKIVENKVLIAAKKIAKDSRPMAIQPRKTLIAQICKQKLSPKYAAWLENHLQFSKQTPATASPTRFITFNIDLGSPHIRVVNAILLKKIGILFTSQSASDLSQSLQYIYENLKKHATEFFSDQIWRDFIFWSVTVTRKSTDFTWTSYDSCQSFDQAVKLKIFVTHDDRLLGEAKIQSPTFDAKNSDFLELFRLITDTQIISRVSPDTRTFTTQIRQELVKELVMLSRHTDSSFDELLSHLRKYDWRTISKPTFWQYFLNQNPVSLPNGATVSNWQSLQLTSRQSKKLESWNPAQTSRHVALFLAKILHEKLVESNSDYDGFSADKVVAAATGFPSDLGSPLQYLANRGVDRSIDYIRQFWDIRADFAKGLHEPQSDNL